MKHLLSIIIALCLASCASSEPYTPAPAPPAGSYIITHYDENRKVLNKYEVESYNHNFFPPSVSFDANGKRVTIRGSWDVTEKPAP